MPAITGTTIMILTNVGLQLFNSMRGNRTNEAMRQKQQEFQRASQERNHERMMQLLRESQALQEEWEKEMHDTRVNNINEDFDQLISRVFQQQALQHWPLFVLPMVMKNQSLGSYRAKSDENIALHVILTPSNSQSFNNSVFPQIEQGVEAFCNRHWNTHSNHPILFYGGAWKSRTAPSENDISQLKADLPHLPVLLISPYFTDNDDKLVFNINMWGVGQTQEAVIVPTDKEFSYYNIYAKEMNYGEELASTTIEEFIPYLQCLIGYLADVYFWSAHSEAPILPSLLTIGAINTDGMKYLLSSNESRYSDLMINATNNDTDAYIDFDNLYSLYIGNIPIWNEKIRNEKLEELFMSCANYFFKKDFLTLEDVADFATYTKTDAESISIFPFLRTIYSSHHGSENEYLKHPAIKNILNVFTEVTQEDYEVFDIPNFEIKHISTFAECKKIGAIAPDNFNFIVWNNNIIIGTFDTKENTPCIYLKNHNARFFIFRNKKDSYECNWNGKIYNYNLTTKKLIEMKKTNFETQFGRGFERIGRGVGKILDGITSVDMMPQDSVWDDDPHEQVQDDGMQKLLSHFIANAGKSVPAERVDNMSLQVVLDWVDENITPFAEKVYIVRGYSEEYKKYVFCVFFGSNDKIFIKEDSPKVCFITSQYNEEMKQTFKENNICIIPLK